MYSPNGKRAGRGILMVAALAAVAILALSGLAAARGHHGERHRHGQDTGTIASFDSASGMLAIELTGGETVSGLVTPGTRIKCEDQSSSDSSVRGREGEPGDDNGANCSESDLVVGAVVHAAELDLRNGKAGFDEVELAG